MGLTPNSRVWAIRRRSLWAKSVTYVLGTSATHVSGPDTLVLVGPPGFEPGTSAPQTGSHFL